MAEIVVRLLDRLEGSGARCWVDGGGGIDALLGQQSREHRDLDLVVDEEDLTATIDLLRDEGYTTIRDWLPTAIASAARQTEAKSTCTRFAARPTVEATRCSWTM